jgi:hypothetical protein
LIRSDRSPLCGNRNREEEPIQPAIRQRPLCGREFLLLMDLLRNWQPKVRLNFRRLRAGGKVMNRG